MPFIKKAVPIIAILFFIIGGSILGAYTTKTADKHKQDLAEIVKQDNAYVTVGKTKIPVEIANTASKRQIGLGATDKLKTGQGMLFIFSKKDVMEAFWMKNMKFDIDIIWINDGKVSQIDQFVPAPEPDVADSDLPLYRPFQAVDYVLEVNAGFVKKNDISVGDSVDMVYSIE